VDHAAIVLLGAAVLLLAALLVAVLLRHPRGGAELLQPQLLALRDRVDALATEVPRTLADGGLAQQRVLADVRERLVQLGATAQELRRVGEAVADVQQLLQAPRPRGALGELWLEELLRELVPGRYEMQYALGDGARVDAVLKLGGRLVPVDAKFPLDAFNRMLALDGEAAQRERRQFVRALKAQMSDIARKYIRPEEGTYEFALMYVPAERVYAEAILQGEDPDDGTSVFACALRERVIPVSPLTFHAYLLVILHGLKGLQLEDGARRLLGELDGLRVAFGKLRGTLDTLSTHLANARGKAAAATDEAQAVAQRLERLTEAEGVGPGASGGGRSGGLS
jgi:DNA recombination protein RmuC